MILTKNDLYSDGTKRYIGNEDSDFHFLEAGYFHANDCTGDFHYYCRYVVNGVILELLEDDVHRIKRMTVDDRNDYINGLKQFYNQME